MDKQKRIDAELARLNEIYKDLPENTYAVLQPLIENAAFMKVTLEDLAEEIQKTGAVETYQNGANQTGRKQAAALQAYDRIIKDYNNVMKTLSAKLPTVVKEYVVREPFEAKEKTPEEIAAEKKEQDRADLRLTITFAEAQLLQLDGWRRDKQITEKEYTERTEEERRKMAEAKEALQRLDE